MGRSEARLQFGCWRGGLNGLGPLDKLVYVVVLTEPTLSQCGVGAIRLARWAKDASLTVQETEKALQNLVSGTWLVLDEDTDEVFVRSFIRNDGVVDQPYVLKGALREALKVESVAIRRALAAELRRLPPRQPDRKSEKTGRMVSYPDPHATADEIDPGPDGGPADDPSDGLFGEPTRKPSERVSSPPAEGSTDTSHEKGLETLRGGGGGGGGGGGSTPVATQVETTTDEPARKTRQHPDTPDGRARTLTDAYYDRNPLSNYIGVLKIVKKAMQGGYSDDRIAGALDRLASEPRAVTSNTLLIALNPNGPKQVRSQTARAVEAADEAWNDFEARHGGNVHQLNFRSEGA